jgi:uncharacterized membrane protein YciS (DUF1049 family)
MNALKTGFWALFFIALVSICVSFATQNNDLMTLNFFSYTTEARPKWQLLLGAVLIGAILAAIILIIELIVLESKNIVLRRINKKLERTLQEHTNGKGSQSEPTLSPNLSDSDV